MGEIHPPQRVKYLAGLLVAEAEQIDPVRRRLESLLGPIDLSTDPAPFDYTDYYQAEMGSLIRLYVAFERLEHPSRLAEIKRTTNEIEDHWRRPDGGRQVNVDPGYLGLAQLVLASTKHFAHRIYLASGIYGEVTLQFQGGSFTRLPWTYPDYQAHTAVFNQWRLRLKEQLQAQPTEHKPKGRDA